MDRSPRFGSISSDNCPMKTRFRYGSGGFPLTKPLPMSRRLILQQARGQSLSPPTAWELTGSLRETLIRAPVRPASRSFMDPKIFVWNCGGAGSRRFLRVFREYQRRHAQGVHCYYSGA
ncbi:unnamed protein product [Linum trigynum]|uniref:Uncharacterized protein n=1 Tax=Linum trigynum TaxID=586398 RepID=A0AAV2EM83_9ROSI